MFDMKRLKNDKTCKLKLAGETNSSEYFTRRKDSPKYISVKLVVGDKHDHRCKFCGFQGEGLEIVNLDQDYRNNDINNLVPSCEFCTRPQLLDFYGMDYQGDDRMIYLPDIRQDQLSLLYRALIYSISKGGDNAYNAQMIYAQLKDQASFLDEKMGSELSHPAQFSHYLKSKKADPEFINKIRWLPSLDLKHYPSLAPSLVEEYDMLIESDKKRKIKAARAAS
jgi:intracellular multiplication protein IcmJ